MALERIGRSAFGPGAPLRRTSRKQSFDGATGRSHPQQFLAGPRHPSRSWFTANCSLSR